MRRVYVALMPNVAQPIGVAETANLLQVNVSTVHRLIRRGALPAVKMPGKRGPYVIQKSDVEALLTQAERSAS